MFEHFLMFSIDAVLLLMLAQCHKAYSVPQYRGYQTRQFEPVVPEICSVSSVLNHDVKNCGKQLMFDDNEETCWCSDQGTPQWLALAFKDPIKISSLVIQFQGGFVGKDCEVVMDKVSGPSIITKFYPDDNNKVQTFDVETVDPCSKLVIKFPESTDFFGRIVIYKLDILGSTVNNT